MSEYPFEEELTKWQIHALQHLFDGYSFNPLQNVFPGGRFEGLTFLQWYDLYARGLICRNECVIELTKAGVDLLARGGWL